MEQCPSIFKSKAAELVQYVERDNNAVHIKILVEEVNHHHIDKDLVYSLIFALKQWLHNFITLNIHTIDG